MKKDIMKIHEWVQKHYKISVILCALLSMSIIVLIIFNVNTNHLAYSHLMYLPVVFVGSFLGSRLGLTFGILGGLAVGPFIPYLHDTGEPQLLINWLVRLSMMAIVGYMSGWFAHNYQTIADEMKTFKEIDPFTDIDNYNALTSDKFEHEHKYAFASLFIKNHEQIKNVKGYKLYYQYLKTVADTFKTYYPELHVFIPSHHKLWFTKPLNHIDSDIDVFFKILNEIHDKPEIKPLFIDFAVGFFHLKHFDGEDVTTYFTYTDTAASEAEKSNLPYLNYEDMKSNKSFQYELLANYKEAIINRDLYLVYQPKIDFKTKKPIGLEALIRWNYQRKQLLSPDQFISAIEETSLIHDMTLEVFKWSLEFQEKLNHHGIFLPVSINVSAKNLYDLRFYDKMVEIISQYQVKPEKVELEITESILMEHPDESKKVLEDFVNFGFKIAIDDFGKGYSSLAYLSQFPIHTIKIDKFFTNQMLLNDTSKTIVMATIGLAKQLGYQVLAEGVEDLKTAELLEKLGCHSAQGYYFLKPQKEAKIIEYLKINTEETI